MTPDDLAYIDRLGAARRPFVSLISYDTMDVRTYPMDELEGVGLYFDSPLLTYRAEKDSSDHIALEVVHSDRDSYTLNLKQAIRYTKDGHSYLLNFTDETLVRASASLEDIFYASRALFRIYLRDEFVCFSPERFVQIIDDQIHTYPMKGTIDATIADAEKLLLENIKEVAEHNTIVDLLRNDLSIIATDVRVEQYRYITEIHTPQKKILQASSHISGQLSSDWHEHIGSLTAALLPAGSISGAPKQRTLEIIDELENHQRGFYTGIAIFYDGVSLDSAVLIRYMQATDTPGEYLYKSGGGITALSDVDVEYQELLDKIYVPIF